MNQQFVNPIMEDDAIFAKLEKLCEEKPKFILHIVRSFFPICKVKRVENFAKQELRNRRCCISDQQLIDIHSIAKYLSKRDSVPYDMVYPALLDKRMMIQQIEQDIKDLDKRVALIGEKTDKMLCLQAYNQLILFIKNKFEMHDKFFMSRVYGEFIEAYKEEINKRFDTSVKWHKCSPETQMSFNLFVNERMIPGLTVNIESIWESASGRDYIKRQHNENFKKYETESQRNPRAKGSGTRNPNRYRSNK